MAQNIGWVVSLSHLPVVAHVRPDPGPGQRVLLALEEVLHHPGAGHHVGLLATGRATGRRAIRGRGKKKLKSSDAVSTVQYSKNARFGLILLHVV